MINFLLPVSVGAITNNVVLSLWPEDFFGNSVDDGVTDAVFFNVAGCLFGG